MDSTPEKRGPGRPRKIVDNTEAEAPKVFPVKLLRNYVPRGEYKILTPVPPPMPGLDQPRKLWAGTVVELPMEEARGLIENTREYRRVVVDDQGLPVIDNRGRTSRRTVTTREPLAERADGLPA